MTRRCVEDKAKVSSSRRTDWEGTKVRRSRMCRTVYLEATPVFAIALEWCSGVVLWSGALWLLCNSRGSSYSLLGLRQWLFAGPVRAISGFSRQIGASSTSLWSVKDTHL
ncbi:hypothetical protein BR93DRAFT_817798 [Coniochaeta sp. PMI_546]|nr:hypothetical protein BR93DRAFT_817798 [Coniochaeta sp. PMI_546]